MPIKLTIQMKQANSLKNINYQSSYNKKWKTTMNVPITSQETEFVIQNLIKKKSSDELTGEQF